MGVGKDFLQAVLLFMVVCVLTFVFFKRRGENPEETLSQKLLRAACRKIEKYLEKNDTITPEMMAKQLKGLTVRDSWLRKNMRIDDPQLKRIDKLALILGTEGDGLCDRTIAACDYTVLIPMDHGVDSLNVAAASAVAFWELRNR